MLYATAADILTLSHGQIRGGERLLRCLFSPGVDNVTMPFDKTTEISRVPTVFESGKSIIIAVIADAVRAPTLDSVLAGPLVLLQQPPSLTGVAGFA